MGRGLLGLVRFQDVFVVCLSKAPVDRSLRGAFEMLTFVQTERNIVVKAMRFDISIAVKLC